MDKTVSLQSLVVEKYTQLLHAAAKRRDALLGKSTPIPGCRTALAAHPGAGQPSPSRLSVTRAGRSRRKVCQRPVVATGED